MPQYFQKPENALRRANEFIEIGKKDAALDVLYDVIKSKKHRNWQKIHEPILRAYLTLCVDLKRSVNAKEGLYQYKLICQQINYASLEEIVTFFLQLAEKNADDAKNHSIEQVTVEDLDQVQTPENILLSSVSSEDAQDRSDRVLLTPWVKFLWEAYRNVLELLRNNNRVEKLYQETAQNAFKFCLKYNRRAEFRKLCVLIKNHLDQVLKYQGQPTAINLNNPESLQMHLETRLFQLENAITMELWQEAFKAIEGIHSLMQMSKKPPKPHMMANYYEKVALVFFKASNMLFHAASLLKLFVLIKEQKKTVTAEELLVIGSKVLLAVLSIPIPAGRSSMEEYLSYDTLSYDKERRLTTLLGLINIPTRKTLIEDMESYILPYVSAELKDLYFFLETKFEPLKLGKKVDSVLNSMKSNEDLAKYIEPLHVITISRTLKQISQVYETITFNRLLKMLPFANVHQLERMIVNCVKNDDAQMSINHQTKSVSFGSALVVALKEEVPDGPHIQAMPSDILRAQICSLSSGLNEAIALLKPEDIRKQFTETREQLTQQYMRNDRREHIQLLNRKSVIEARKEKIESMRSAQENYERSQQKMQREKLRIAEETRLEIEREKREKERKIQEMKEIQKQQVWDRVESLRGTDVGKRAFKNLTDKEINEMDPDDILQRQYEQLDREKREQMMKLRAQEKRVDHLVRAIRMEEIPLREKFLAEKKVKDENEWDREEAERIKNSEKEHQMALKAKARFERMQGDKNAFLDQLYSNRQADFQARLQEFNDKLEDIRQERLEARRKQRVAQRRKEFIMARREQKRKEKEEQLLREKQAEEERKRKEAEEKRLQEEERERQREESARKQREREREIEEKLASQRVGGGRDPQVRGGGRADDSGSAPSGGGGGGGGGGGVGGKYIPPHLRAKMQAAAGGSSGGDSGGSESPRRDDVRGMRRSEENFGRGDDRGGSEWRRAGGDRNGYQDSPDRGFSRGGGGGSRGYSDQGGRYSDSPRRDGYGGDTRGNWGGTEGRSYRAQRRDMPRSSGPPRDQEWKTARK